MTRTAAIGGILALAALLGAAFGGPGFDARAIAAAAGTLYEAAPFLLLVYGLERRVARHGRGTRAPWLPLLGLAGCGCSRAALPGALALPAIALCALTFGPGVSAVRIAVGLCIVLVRRTRPGAQRPHEPAPVERSDPFATLESLATSAFVASLLVAGFAGIAAQVPRPLALVAGFAIGALAPCATAGVAIAAAFAHATPWAAIGILASTGLVSPTVFRHVASRLSERLHRVQVVQHFTSDRRAKSAADALATRPHSALFPSLVLASALATLALRGPSGLVNPRLLPPIAGASLVAFALRGSLRSRSAHPLLAPALMLAVAIAPPMPQPPPADATRLDDAFAGERLAFTGQVTRRGAQTTLARYVITCCRIDATPVAVRLDRALATREGTWLDVRGTLVRDPAGALVLHAEHVRAIAAPPDPFVYR